MYTLAGPVSGLCAAVESVWAAVVSGLGAAVVSLLALSMGRSRPPAGGLLI